MRLEVAEINLNRPNLRLPGCVSDEQDKPEWARGEAVYVRMDLLDAAEGPEWEWWK